MPDRQDVGLSLAEVRADDGAVITKLAGTGGRVGRLTCTAQLRYEIEDPARDLQPAVVVEPSQVHLQGLGADRVPATGASASGTLRPAQLRATLGNRDGWIGEGQIANAGPGAAKRFRRALQVLQHRLRGLGLAETAQRAELIGGQVMMFSADFAVTVPQYKAGKIRCLAVTSMQRAATTSDMATVNEALGLKDYELIAYFAAYAPAGTPAEVINKLETDKWEKSIRDAKIEPQ